ncbi:hypothetical protein EJ08DRAFT_483426 [Tothia fuscella]|uniref:Uncharacterized protein n=1 Tax=Tothia fuscella TaxID=1048955 RepID=A0A9P4NIA0_9PEZI|nr:hypothetical protein EJ08DRAFT_483426 [Tothia fuscella]
MSSRYNSRLPSRLVWRQLGLMPAVGTYNDRSRRNYPHIFHNNGLRHKVIPELPQDKTLLEWPIRANKIPWDASESPEANKRKGSAGPWRAIVAKDDGKFHGIINHQSRSLETSSFLFSRFQRRRTRVVTRTVKRAPTSTQQDRRRVVVQRQSVHSISPTTQSVAPPATSEIQSQGPAQGDDSSVATISSSHGSTSTFRTMNEREESSRQDDLLFDDLVGKLVTQRGAMEKRAEAAEERVTELQDTMDQMSEILKDVAAKLRDGVEDVKKEKKRESLSKLWHKVRSWKRN